MVVIHSADFLYSSGNFLSNNVYFLLKIDALGNFLKLWNPIPLSAAFLAITDKLCLSIAQTHVHFSFICLNYIFCLLAEIININLFVPRIIDNFFFANPCLNNLTFTSKLLTNMLRAHLAELSKEKERLKTFFLQKSQVTNFSLVNKLYKNNDSF